MSHPAASSVKRYNSSHFKSRLRPFRLQLAKELGRTAWEVRQGDDDGRNMKSEARMMGIQVCNGQEAGLELLPSTS